MKTTSLDAKSENHTSYFSSYGLINYIRNYTLLHDNLRMSSCAMLKISKLFHSFVTSEYVMPIFPA